tara:strand:+ start:473 stop:1438 length:966 start_codon:yes stop_codon:yes gene_type:complete
LTTIQITPENENIRLDQFLSSELQDFSRTHIQKLIKMGFVLVNGTIRKPGFRLFGGENIKVELPDENPAPEILKPENIPLKIVFEDDVIVVLDKPAGLVVHPGAGIKEGTLVNGLVYYFKSLSNISGSPKPGIVHRLDKDTSGLILVAKTNSAHLHLANQFETRSVVKKYMGITWGEWKPISGKIEEPITRKRSDRTSFTVSTSGRSARTDYEVVEAMRYLSLVRFFPRTGRTHQIRVHSAFHGNPIFSDEKYNGGLNRIKGFLPEISKKLKTMLNSIGRQALHAYELSITHPTTEEQLQFEAPLPEDFTNLIEDMKELNV